jgi:hypothetical protein
MRVPSPHASERLDIANSETAPNRPSQLRHLGREDASYDVRSRSVRARVGTLPAGRETDAGA